jgi:PilZ domain-containing protein
MSTRSTWRRKVVLPVTVIRNNGEKSLAHTLDVTMSSARLGGLFTSVDPGEVVEIQRGALRAKFQVVWVGAANSALGGQAGAHGLFTGKNVWGVDLPADQPDLSVDTNALRSRYPLVCTGRGKNERRWHRRLECTGSASVLAPSGKFPVYAEIKDISLGGVYLETATAFPVNTKVHLKMNVAGIAVDMPGTVRTSKPQVGMGIGFQRASRENEERLAMAVQTLERESLQPGTSQEQVVTMAPQLVIVRSRAV